MEIIAEKPMFSHSSRGFSRTELLVTIGCLAALAATLLIWRSRNPELARRKACENKIKQILHGFDGYEQANGRLPRAARLRTTSEQDWIFWQASRDLEESAIALYTVKFDTNLLRCPGDNRVRYRAYQYSYTMNAELEKRQRATLNSKPLILLYEEDAPNDGACAATSSSDRLTTRHGGKSNAGFLDGHVERISQSVGSLDKHVRP